MGQALRHEGAVVAASFNEGGQRIVTGASDKTARVWDATRYLLLSQPLRHQGRVVAACLSPDGNSVLTACEDQTAWLWEAESSAARSEPVRPDDQAASAGAGVELSISHAPGNTFVHSDKNGTLVVVEDDTLDAVSSPDGRWIVTASATKARLWNAATTKPKGEPLLHEGGVVAASLSADGRWVVITAQDQGLRVWDTSNGKPRGEPLRQDQAVLTASVSPDGQRVVTASAGHTVRLWDAESGTPLGSPLFLGSAVRSAFFSPDGRRIVTVTEDNTGRAWDIAAPDTDAPPWLWELAEALGGLRLGPDGAPTSPEKTLYQLRKELMDPASPHALNGDDFWPRFGKWFFTRGPKRTISPDSKITVGELEHLEAEAEKERVAKPNSPPPSQP